MIDWNRLTLTPAIRRMGALLRDEFGVWVGFIDEHGKSHPIAGGLAPIDKPGCQRLMATSVLSNQDGDRKTCVQSIRRWSAAAQEASGSSEDGPAEVSCHAGFSAMLFPLELTDADSKPEATSGCLYVSGWVPSEMSHRVLGEIRKTLEDNALMREDGPGEEEAIDRIPRLDRRERGFVRSICDNIVEEVERLFAEPDTRASVVVEGESFHGMVAASPKVLDLFETISIVADSNSTVLIEGENGTGKELIARALHLESRRSERPFVALNCAAIPGDLIASELFGHKKGAFSGAHRDRVGLLAEADGGTLLLDEIGDMDLHLQVKLLRFLQEGTYMPVGANDTRKVDVRVLCATNQDLRELVRQSTFRKDLYFRINVINLTSPPLRRRRGDVKVLAEHFLARAAKRHDRPIKTLSDTCLEKLEAHHWPGNVRELENEIERLVIMSGDEEHIAANLLSERVAPSEAEPDFPGFEGMELPEAVEQLERTMILEQLRETGWNKSQTARNLGVSRRNLIRKVSRYELERFRED